MKDSDIKRTMRQLEKVWPRVAGKGPEHGPPPPPPPRPPKGPPPPPPPEDGMAETLAALIGMETAAERRYTCMAQRAGSANAAALRRLASESRGLVKKLQAEYYLRTGDSVPAPRGPQEKCRPLGETLRLAWSAAGAAENACRDAERRTDDPALRELFARAAEQKQAQRKTLRDLARRLMR